MTMATKVLKLATSCQVIKLFPEYLNTKLQFTKKINGERFWHSTKWHYLGAGHLKLPVLGVGPTSSLCSQFMVLWIHESSILNYWIIYFINSLPSVIMLHNLNIKTRQHCSSFDKRVLTQRNSISAGLQHISPKGSKLALGKFKTSILIPDGNCQATVYSQS